jgi:transposase
MGAKEGDTADGNHKREGPGRCKAGVDGIGELGVSALAAYVGVAPGTRASGLRWSAHAHLNRIGHSRLRRALYMATFAAVQRNVWLGAYYRRLKARGKLPKVALVATMRKLLVAVYSIAKHRRPFVTKGASRPEQLNT